MNTDTVSAYAQEIVKSMGCGLLAHLVNEEVTKKDSLEHCNTAITHLTKVGINCFSL